MGDMIKEQVFALELESVISQMERLQLEEKVTTLLNDFFDQVCDKSISRRTVEFVCEHEGMEIIVGELKVPTFYFYKEKQFWKQLNCLLKSPTQTDYWLKTVILQMFYEDWCMEPFFPKEYPRRTCQLN